VLDEMVDRLGEVLDGVAAHMGVGEAALR